MKVLLVNGSPHQKGCTYTALCEVSDALNNNGVDTDVFWIGKKALSGCIVAYRYGCVAGWLVGFVPGCVVMEFCVG